MPPQKPSTIKGSIGRAIRASASFTTDHTNAAKRPVTTALFRRNSLCPIGPRRAMNPMMPIASGTTAKKYTRCHGFSTLVQAQLPDLYRASRPHASMVVNVDSIGGSQESRASRRCVSGAARTRPSNKAANAPVPNILRQVFMPPNAKDKRRRRRPSWATSSTATQATSAWNLTPRALATLSTVAKVGLPFSPRALYRLSRLSPASRAT